MQTNKLYLNNYTRFNENNQLVLPLNFEMLIPEDDSVRLLSEILEGLSYRKLDNAYSPNGRKSALNPRIMFKILVYAYMNNIYSSRKIEQACKRDINFMWLLNGNKAPDHSTISRFRKDYLPDSIEDLFYQLVKYLKENNEIEYENLFVDGTKIEANANKYSFVWQKAISKNQTKMYNKIQSKVVEINKIYLTNFIIEKGKVLEGLRVIKAYLDDVKEKENIEFVSGIGKRKSILQRLTEDINEFYERQAKYDEYNKMFDGRNSFSKTDTDATFMHMKEDHMKNSQLKPGYNVQIGVESEYIVGVGIYSDRSDSGTLIPFLDNLSDRLNLKYKNIIADSGYESEENYVYLENRKQTYYIKPQTYEKWKKRSFKNDISKRENMYYDSDKDEYICHNKKRLKMKSISTKTSATGYRSNVTIYECESCEGCPHKSKCTKSKGNRQLSVSKNFIEKRQISYDNITSEIGIKLRMNRSIQVEGAFGVLKEDYNFKRFLTRGKKNVLTEFLLLCFGYNINKYHAKIQINRCGIHLYETKIA